MADNIISEVELEMGISIEHLVEEFGKIRTGRANPSLVTGIQVEYYGVKTPLQQDVQLKYSSLVQLLK